MRFLTTGGGTKVFTIQLVETSSTQPEFFGCGGAGEVPASEGSENFTDQRCAQTARKRTFRFFIKAKRREWNPNIQQVARLPASAVRRQVGRKRKSVSDARFADDSVLNKTIVGACSARYAR